jgi:hypothetical protein
MRSRRVLSLTALLLALLVLPVSTPAQTGKGAAKPQPKPIVTTSSVFYREKGAANYTLFGYYASEKSGRAIFEHLVRSGYEVELRISNTPIPKTPPLPVSGLLPVAETVTVQKATDVFNWMARQSDIAYRYPTDGCYARAELMIERMQKNGFKPRKIWSVANGEELYARTKNHPRGFVTWAYHVAPVLRVRTGEKSQRWYVIDPSLSTKPMTITEWEKAQMRTATSTKPYLTLTRPGKPPKWIDHKYKAGTGYWPGTDPGVGVHAHAVATMKKYKPFEGKLPPKSFARRGPAGPPAWVVVWREPLPALLPRRWAA